MSSRRHGRASMPFGKWKGVQLRHIPPDYLSWLATARYDKGKGALILEDEKWWWLRESLIAELEHRGMPVDLAEGEPPPRAPAPINPNARKFRA